MRIFNISAFFKGNRLPGDPSPANPLRVTLAAGLALFILISAALSFFYFSERSFTKTTRQMDNFARLIRGYDSRLGNIAGDRGNLINLSRDLDRLEKSAIGVESWLSVLKRRRALSRLDPGFLENYRASINKALEAYPRSQPIVVIAAGALINNAAINRETRQTLRGWLPLITDPLFDKARLAVYVLLGDFSSPQTASVIPSDTRAYEEEDIALNMIILKVIRSDIKAAESDLQRISRPSPSANAIRLAAEFNYDFGDLARSAELFSALEGNKALARQADALYLAGYKRNSRAIWGVLSDANNQKSVYNLAITAEDSDEAAVLFERLININAEDMTLRQFALIRYSRLLDSEKALARLRNAEGLRAEDNPFIDLEIQRRQAQTWPLGRQIAEAWMLLDRHEGNEDMYRWAAWLFLFQRNYDEIKILLNRAGKLLFEEEWVKTYTAMIMMFEGNLDAAENVLRSISPAEAKWTVHANLGRIMEASRSPSRALAEYNLALEKAQNPKTRAKIQINIAKCLSALNQPIEAALALMAALEQDPENLNARLELDRLSY